jgi:hypothetical protein
MHLGGLQNFIGSFRGILADTTLVLFFLGLESGRAIQDFTFDAFLLFATMLLVMVLPYYLPAGHGRPAFAKWLTGRSLIALLGLTLGLLLGPAFGTVLPESFRFLPLTLLILAAMATSFIQFYGLMRLRLAK